jgi:hypothetical protein
MAMKIRCRHCQKSFQWKGRGRVPVFCSASCRQRAYEVRKFERAIYARGPQAALDKDLAPLRARIEHAQGPLVLRTRGEIAKAVEKILVETGLLSTAPEGMPGAVISEKVTNSLLDAILKKNAKAPGNPKR